MKTLHKIGLAAALLVLLSLIIMAIAPNEKTVYLFEGVHNFAGWVMFTAYMWMLEMIISDTIKKREDEKRMKEDLKDIFKDLSGIINSGKMEVVEVRPPIHPPHVCGGCKDRPKTEGVNEKLIMVWIVGNSAWDNENCPASYKRYADSRCFMAKPIELKDAPESKNSFSVGSCVFVNGIGMYCELVSEIDLVQGL